MKKRVLAMLLCCIIAAGLLPCFAAAQAIEAENQNQIIPETGGENSDNYVKVSKTIAGTNNENYFDITLTVETQSNISEIYAAQDMAVVMVMDISESMMKSENYVEMEGSSVPQYVMAKRAADEFISTFCQDAASSGVSRQMAIVTFNTNAELCLGFTDCSLENSANSLERALRDKMDATFTSDYYGKSTMFTNIEGGLQLAQNILESRSEANQYIILLTDGFPTTYSVNKVSNETSTSYIAGYSPYMSQYTGTASLGTDGVFSDQVSGNSCKYGTSYSDKGALYAEEAAQSIEGVTIFPIGINIGGQQISSMNRLGSNADGFSVVDCFADITQPFTKELESSGKYKYVEGEYVIGRHGAGAYGTAYKNWLATQIGSNFYKDGDNLQELQNAFTAILAKIKEISQESVEASWVASDPMNGSSLGQSIEFLNFYQKDGTPVAELTGGSWVENGENTAKITQGSLGEEIRWDLKKSGFETKVEKLPGDTEETTTYIYTLSYRVRLMNEAEGFDPDKAEHYLTNGPTNLVYQYNDNGVLSGEQTISFPVPKVKGYLGNLEFKKVDSQTGSGLTGVTFTLSHSENCPVCHGQVTIGSMQGTSAGEPQPATPTSLFVASPTSLPGESGMVTIRNIPSGHAYILTENSAPDGYQPLNCSFPVVVSYGITTLYKGETPVTTIQNDPISSPTPTPTATPTNLPTPTPTPTPTPINSPTPTPSWEERPTPRPQRTPTATEPIPLAPPTQDPIPLGPPVTGDSSSAAHNITVILLSANALAASILYRYKRKSR